MNEQTIKTIREVAKKLAPKYTFGHYDVEDIEQEAFIIGMAAMEQYDPSRPLENFLTVSINNRLKSFKRDNHCRPEQDQEQEEKWRRWFKRYNSKIQLQRPISLQDVSVDTERRMYASDAFIEDIVIEEVMDLIDRELPIEYREDYMRLKRLYEDPKCGIVMQASKRQKIEDEIIRILEDNGYEDW
jgi:DNA-directed RNA polymerase specialized sigma24 family protein